MQRLDIRVPLVNLYTYDQKSDNLQEGNRQNIFLLPLLESGQAVQKSGESRIGGDLD